MRVHITMDTTDIYGNTIVDASGNGNDATIVSSSGNPAGLINEALTFDGSSDYSTIPALNLNSNAVTISAWVKTNGSPDDWDSILQTHGSSNAGILFGPSNQLRYVWDGTYWDWDTGLNVPDAEWVFVALVVEPDKATVYMNGDSVTNIAANNTQQFESVTLIGSDSPGYRQFDGEMDDVAIWNRSLSSDEINYIYSKGLNGETLDSPNLKPKFTDDPFSNSGAIEGRDYSGTLTDKAYDPDEGDVLTFSLVSDPAWLMVAADGQLSGVAKQSNVGNNDFIVRVTDAEGLYDEALMNIYVLGRFTGELGISDLAYFVEQWLTTDCGSCSNADLDGDGDVDMNDWAIFAGYWLN
jgi:hypothetical protein